MDQLISRALPWIAISLVVYVLAGAVYRLYFSPLAKFPGPKLAALTLWYEFYYDVIKKGRYTWEIRRMHEKYGTLVRRHSCLLHQDTSVTVHVKVPLFALVPTRSMSMIPNFSMSCTWGVRLGDRRSMHER